MYTNKDVEELSYGFEVNQKVNEKIDKTIDKVEDDYIVMDYEFTCPNCGHKWTKNEALIGNVLSIKDILLVVSQVTGVEIERITPKSNLCDDLGADHTKKEHMLLKIEQQLGQHIEKETDSFVFVDDIIEAVTGESYWDKEDEGEAGLSEKTSSLKFTPEESEYMEEVKDVLADGEISERERKLLDKIRVKLGISEERGKELEVYLSKPSLTTEEQEYLNEYRDIVSEGEITPRDQRFLDKLKRVNGISEERAAEIENLCQTNI